MDYLFGSSGEPSEWVDPVCGMPVWDGGPYLANDAFGRPQRFCSSLCLAAFLAFPSAFTWPPSDTPRRNEEPELQG
jgi:YHS domain-containing protein